MSDLERRADAMVERGEKALATPPRRSPTEQHDLCHLTIAVVGDDYVPATVDKAVTKFLRRQPIRSEPRLVVTILKFGTIPEETPTPLEPGEPSPERRKMWTCPPEPPPQPPRSPVTRPASQSDTLWKRWSF